MKKNNYRLAAIDLDDTLLDSKKNIRPYTFEVLKRLSGKGLIIVLATGRNFRGSKRYYDQLMLSHPIINCSGASVADSRQNHLYSLPMNPHDVRDILFFAKENKLHAQIETTDHYYFLRHSKYSDTHAFFYGYRGIEVPDIDELGKITALKVLIISEISTIERIKPIAEKKFSSLKVLRSLPSFLEFNNPGTSKGTALEFLMSFYSLKKEQVIAFGDSELDFSMVDKVDIFIAVDNASDKLKSMAAYVTGSNDEEGVAKALSEIFGC